VHGCRCRREVAESGGVEGRSGVGGGVVGEEGTRTKVCLFLLMAMYRLLRVCVCLQSVCVCVCVCVCLKRVHDLRCVCFC